MFSASAVVNLTSNHVNNNYHALENPNLKIFVTREAPKNILTVFDEVVQYQRRETRPRNVVKEPHETTYSLQKRRHQRRAWRPLYL